MLRYKATMKYSEAAIYSLCRTQHSIYNGWKSMLVVALCIFVMSVAVTADMGQIYTVLLLGLCGVTIAMANYPPKYKAKATVCAMKGVFPETSYLFNDGDIVLQSGEGQKTLGYDAVIRVHHDARYIYLFISRTQAYMLDKTCLIPDDADALLRFLAEKTKTKVSRSREGARLGIKSLLSGGK